MVMMKKMTTISRILAILTAVLKKLEKDRHAGQKQIIARAIVKIGATQSTNTIPTTNYPRVIFPAQKSAAQARRIIHTAFPITREHSTSLEVNQN
jgi:hypothetical protein